MSIHNPPQYRYSFFKPQDKEIFEFIKKFASQKHIPQILGSSQSRNQFLTTLIRTQKSLHDWRQFLVDVIQGIKDNDSIDTNSLNKKYPPESISKKSPAWVTYEEDKIVSEFIDWLGNNSINFSGSDEDFVEFTCRFILGQLGHDWEQTIFMIWEALGNNTEISLKYLNSELTNFDYLGVFRVKRNSP